MVVNEPIEIRHEQNSDILQISKIHKTCFETSMELSLVDELRVKANPFVSLVAVLKGVVVGNVFFSPMTFDGEDSQKLMGLAPLAVLPLHHSIGIGAKLVNAGVVECSAMGVEAIAVLGNPQYYGRFDFVNARGFGISSVYKNVPEGSFMIKELKTNCLGNRLRIIHYHKAFDRFSSELEAV